MKTKNARSLAVAAAMLAMMSGHAMADELLGSYNAYIGEDDLYNSQGARLKAPWEVLRQDRANYHKFGISQDGDEDDPFFSSIENRSNMEYLVSHGKFSRQAARTLLRGDCMVHVEIYGRNGVGDFVSVTVSAN